MLTQCLPSGSGLSEFLQELKLNVPCACESPQTCAAAVVEEVVGTKRVRKGPRPDDTSLSSMTQVVEKYINLGMPIPFMAPWGSEKPDGSTIDIAELCALRTIQCLNDRVCKHYGPGIICHIRVEDVSAPHLFYDRADEARKEAQLYSDAFEALVKVLGCKCIKIKRESERVSEETFNQAADEVLPLMEKHIGDLDSLEAIQALKAIGWKTPVSKEMAEEYLGRYNRLYPEKSPAEHRHILSRYFSGVLARNKLNLRGDDASWEGCFLDLSFVEASPTSMHSFPRRVYYRTIPANISSNHMPPWRAKGHLVVDQKEGIRPRVASFQEKLFLNQSTATLYGNGSSAMLRCDWQA